MSTRTYLVVCHVCGGRLLATDGSAAFVRDEALAEEKALLAGHYRLHVPKVLVAKVAPCDCAAAHEIDMRQAVTE